MSRADVSCAIPQL